MKNKIKVGDILYSLNINNAARHYNQKLTPVVVVKVGRKYFFCAPVGKEDCIYLHTPYYLSDWRQKIDYSPNSKLYSSPEEWEEEKESNKVCRFILESFNYGTNSRKLSIDKLREIKKIILAEIEEEK